MLRGRGRRRIGGGFAIIIATIPTLFVVMHSVRVVFVCLCVFSVCQGEGVCVCAQCTRIKKEVFSSFFSFSLFFMLNLPSLAFVLVCILLLSTTLTNTPPASTQPTTTATTTTDTEYYSAHPTNRPMSTSASTSTSEPIPVPHLTRPRSTRPNHKVKIFM